MNGARALCLLLVAAVASGCTDRNLNAPVASAAAPNQTLAATLDPGRTVSVEIFANKEWQRTGVILEPGLIYRVTATGRWTLGPLCGMTDANGIGLDPLCQNDPAHLGVSVSSLIGRVGDDGTPFGVGSSAALKPSEKGELFLTDYSRHRAFHAGSLKVDISIEDVASGQPAPAHHDIQ